MVSLPTPAKWAVRLVAVGYVFMLVGWPLLMRCPNESDPAIIAAFGHLGELERLWPAGTKR